MKNKIKLSINWLFILMVIIIALLSPFFNFVLGWVIGWLIKIIFGTTFVKGLSLIHINIIESQIPLFCGIISVISSFFRPSPVKKDDK